MGDKFGLDIPPMYKGYEYDPSRILGNTLDLNLDGIKNYNYDKSSPEDIQAASKANYAGILAANEDFNGLRPNDAGFFSNPFNKGGLLDKQGYIGNMFQGSGFFGPSGVINSGLGTFENVQNVLLNNDKRKGQKLANEAATIANTRTAADNARHKASEDQFASVWNFG